jgi:hypothetical protein
MCARPYYEDSWQRVPDVTVTKGGRGMTRTNANESCWPVMHAHEQAGRRP